MTEHPPIDKSTWGDGPWQHEPDRVEWQHAGLPCLALRNHHGAWCGYAAVPPGHPWHGQPYQDLDVHVHGGLTYCGLCQGSICHVPAPGDPDDVFWFGFDCGHAFDLMPGINARLRQCDPGWDTKFPPIPGMEDHYRDLVYVQGEINRLADQLAAQR